jgi:hypothetical protein
MIFFIYSSSSLQLHLLYSRNLPLGEKIFSGAEGKTGRGNDFWGEILKRLVIHRDVSGDLGEMMHFVLFGFFCFYVGPPCQGGFF